MNGVAPLWLWAGFHLLLLALLLLDHGIARRARKRNRKVPALWYTLAWTGSALLFAVLVGHALRAQYAAEYLTAYGIEGSLSVDNMLVFLLVFRSFGLATEQQRRVLFWGVLGAIVLRACMIAAGLAMVHFFVWANYAFGVVLLLAALRLLRQHTGGAPRQQPRWADLLARHLPLSANTAEDHFFVREEGHWRGTQLLLVLVTIEITDLFFAVDSIPAVLAISHSPFVVYSSNIFAVMGLRSLYFVIAGLLERLRLLHYGLALVLLFVGAKMLLAHVIQVPIAVSLGVLVTVLALTTLLSLFCRPVRSAH
jgi:tellurite resistance protein TerC